MASDFYAAILVYESSSSASDYVKLYSEVTVLVESASLEEAEEKARRLGRDREVSYLNERGETIKWTLRHVVDTAAVDGSLADGTEIYTRHFRNYQAYREFEPLLSGEEL